MQTNNKPAKLPSGGSQIKTVEQFAQLCEAEYHVKYNAMVERYREEKQWLTQRRDRQVEEFKFIDSIIKANTEMISGNLNPATIASVERHIAELNYDSVAGSFTIDYWRIHFGDAMITAVVADIISYFLNQFQVKENLSDIQIMQMSVKLITTQPLLRIRELVFVLDEAVKGSYGPAYNQIGIARIYEWLSMFYENSSEHLEQRMISNKTDESRGDAPWEVVERQIKKYEEEQRTKKQIVDKVWGIEKRRREVEDYKEKTMAEGAAQQ